MYVLYRKAFAFGESLFVPPCCTTLKKQLGEEASSRSRIGSALKYEQETGRLKSPDLTLASSTRIATLHTIVAIRMKNSRRSFKLFDASIGAEEMPIRNLPWRA